jgi:hypothetical protein
LPSFADTTPLSFDNGSDGRKFIAGPAKRRYKNQLNVIQNVAARPEAQNRRSTVRQQNDVPLNTLIIRERAAKNKRFFLFFSSFFQIFPKIY